MIGNGIDIRLFFPNFTTIPKSLCSHSHGESRNMNGSINLNQYKSDAAESRQKIQITQLRTPTCHTAARLWISVSFHNAHGGCR